MKAWALMVTVVGCAFVAGDTVGWWRTEAAWDEALTRCDERRRELQAELRLADQQAEGLREQIEVLDAEVSRLRAENERLAGAAIEAAWEAAAAVEAVVRGPGLPAGVPGDAQ